MSGQGANRDLAIIVLISIMMPLVILLFPVSPFRVVLSLLYLLIIPGYALMTALFPGNSGLDAVERLALGIGLSIALVTLIGLGMNYTPWGVTLDTIIASVTSWTLLCCIAAYYKRIQKRRMSRNVTCLDADMSRQEEKSSIWRSSPVLLTIAMLVVFGISIHSIRHSMGEPYTEFYLLGEDGITEDYPGEIVLDKPYTVIIGLVNHERSDVQYHIVAMRGDEIEHIASVQLSHGETWEEPYSFVPSVDQDNRVLTFLLFKGEDYQPCSTLHLWMRVDAENSGIEMYISQSGTR